MPQIWTSQEEIEFLKGISNKQTIDDLSKKHNRTSSAMELRLKKIVFENMQSGKSETSLAKLLNIDIDKIRQYNYEYKGFLEKKEDGGIINNQTASTLIDKNIINNSSTHTKLTIEPPTKSKTINRYDKKKSSTNVYNHGGGNDNSKEKFISKIKKIKKENKLMKEVVDNKELRKKINKMIKDGSLDKKFKSVLKKVINEE
jgi:hypothetical protein